MRPTPIVLACSLLFLSACADPLYLMHEEHSLENGEERYVGGACQDISASTTSGTGVGGEGPSYAINMTGSDDNSVTVVVSDENGDTLEQRTYDERFLSSGEPDTFVVGRDGIDFLRLKLWGGTTCESPREPD
jgi:hypothetical protein